MGAAFGAGSYLAVKASSATHRALNTYRKRGGDTPKPPKVPRKGGSATKSGSSAGSVGNTPGAGSGSQSAFSPKSPTEEDLDDFDLISPLNTTRSGDVPNQPKPAPKQVKPQNVPRLPLFRLFGGSTPPASAKEQETERREGKKEAKESAKQKRWDEQQSSVSAEGGTADAALTARRAAEALAEEARLKSQLDSARKHLARLEKVVASERKAKMVAVEHAAKVAAAAEALAEFELGPEVGGSPGSAAAPGKQKSVKQLVAETNAASSAKAADSAEDALMSPSTRAEDDLSLIHI